MVSEPTPLQPDSYRADRDALLAGFVSGADDMVQTHTRMQALLSTVISLTKDVTLEAVLDHVVESAARLVGAQYAALGVIGEDRMLKHFLSTGIDEEAANRIGHLPTGHGVLGLLLRDPHPLRLTDLREHPEAYGFPPHHPPMTGFLGVPVRVRDVVFGNLYLTEKADGSEFTAEDEELAVALAAAAGVAIETAHLFEDARIRQDWLQASVRVTATMMRDPADSFESGLRLIVREALRASGSALAMVAVPAGDGDLRMYWAAAEGRRSGDWVGRMTSVASPVVAEVSRTRAAAVVDDASAVLGLNAGGDFGQVLLTAIGSSPPDQQLLVLVRARESARFSTVDTQMSEIFGSQVGLALELARTRRSREDLVLFADRERIARDLHDLVIQRIFAAGLNIQSLRRFTSDEVALERIAAVTGELDHTIRELRDTIYSLHATGGEEEALSSRILRAVLDHSKLIEFSPRLRFSGPVDSGVPPDVEQHVLAIVSEGLSNALKHSGADVIEVSVTAENDHLERVIVDNANGFAERPVAGSGLANMDARARQIGGSLSVESAPGSGTRLVFAAPIAK